MQGWVKLHREVQTNVVWNSTTPEQKVIFMTLLMMVNHSANSWEWEGDKYHVQPGQTITSIDSIVKAGGRGITPQKVRTALKKFEKYGILTDKSTKRGRLITLINWKHYQCDDRNLTDELTVEQPTTIQQLTTNKNERTERMREVGTGNFSGKNPTVNYLTFKKQYEVDEDMDEAITYYLKVFKEKMGREHMNLHPDTWQDIAATLLMVVDSRNRDTPIDISSFFPMVKHYFRKDYNNGKCNRCITHFNDPGIKEVNFYEVGYYDVDDL